MNNKYILLLLCLSSFFSFTSCDDIVNYNDGYTPAEQQNNSGAPVIKAVYDVADTAFTTPITQGTLG